MFASILAAITSLQKVFGSEDNVSFGGKIIVVFVEFTK